MFGSLSYLFFSQLVALFNDGARLVVDCGRPGCEGGGQMLRLGMVFACLTGKRVQFWNIRSGRSVTGMRPQHVAVVRAVAKLSGGLIIGEIGVGCSSFTFVPGGEHALAFSDRYEVDIGSAGSITLLLQALLPIVLLYARRKFTLVLKGGTDVSNSPPMDFFKDVLCGYLQRMNISVETNVIRRGFYPRGGGQVEIVVTPPASIRGITIENGDVQDGVVHLKAMFPSCFPHGDVLKEGLSGVNVSTSEYHPGRKVKAVTYSLHAFIPESGESTRPIRNKNWVCTNVNPKGDGTKDRDGNDVDVIQTAKELTDGVLFDSSGCVEEFSADQLLVFAVIAASRGESSSFACRKEMSSLHFKTMVEMIREMVPDVHLTLEEDGDLYRVTIAP
jgi:RNA 3'-terminal phosphate cyclase